MKDNSVADDPDFKELLNFAQTEYFEIAKEQNRLGLLALGIMGTLIPILISAEQVVSKDILSLTLTGLSFVYFLIAVRYLHHSRRHDQLIFHLNSMHSGFERYFDIPRARTLRGQITWTLINGMIFIFPGFGCLLTAWVITWTSNTTWTLFIWSVWFVFLAMDTVLLVGICTQWWLGRRRSKSFGLVRHF